MISSVSVIENYFTIQQIAKDILRVSDDIRGYGDNANQRAREYARKAKETQQCAKDYYSEAAKWKVEAAGLLKAADMLIVEMSVKNGVESGRSKEEIIQEIVRILEIDCDRAEVLFGEYNEKH